MIFASIPSFEFPAKDVVGFLLKKISGNGWHKLTYNQEYDRYTIQTDYYTYKIHNIIVCLFFAFLGR